MNLREGECRSLYIETLLLWKDIHVIALTLKGLSKHYLCCDICNRNDIPTGADIRL